MKELKDKLTIFKNLVEKENAHWKSIQHNDFISDELNEKYLDLIAYCKEKNIEWYKVESALWENINLDYKKGVKYYLFDIAVIKKDFNYVLKKYPELEKVEHEGL
nr:hypothetical protein [Candidatus Woesearchaeota archaeon]